MGREATPYMHAGDQQTIPDFALHAHLGLPPTVGAEHFWPGLPFPPMFNPALGLPWAAKPPLNVPSFHALLSQYVLAGGGGASIPQGSVQGPLVEERSRSASPERISPAQMSPTRSSIDALRLRAQEMKMSPQLHAKS